MAIVLVPWPTAGTQARTAAIAYVREQCAGRTTESDDAANALGELAAAMVDREAEGAPVAVKTEAAVRIIGYVAQADYGAVIRETSVGNKAIEWTTNHSAIFRNSGAKGLLAPWKIRRAGAIG